MHTFVCVFYTSMYMWRPEEGLDPLKLELQASVGCLASCIDTVIWTLVLMTVFQALLTTEPSLLALVPPYFWDFLCFSYTNFWILLSVFTVPLIREKESRWRGKSIKVTREELTWDTRNTGIKTINLKKWPKGTSTLHKKQARTHDRQPNTSKLTVNVTIFINLSEWILYKLFHQNEFLELCFELHLSFQNPV